MAKTKEKTASDFGEKSLSLSPAVLQIAMDREKNRERERRRGQDR